MPWRFVCDLCGKVEHVRMKGWWEAIDVPPIIDLSSLTGEPSKAVTLERARSRERGSGGRLMCPACTKHEYPALLRVTEERYERYG